MTATILTLSAAVLCATVLVLVAAVGALCYLIRRVSESQHELLMTCHMQQLQIDQLFAAIHPAKEEDEA